MRLLVFLACVALATASPLKKSINAKAIEPVDQHLDSGSGANVDRAKKDVTFCVEVRQDKSVVVDCADRQPIQPAAAVIPAPAPAPEPQPQPEPQPEPQQPNQQQYGHTTIFHPIVVPNTQPIILPGGASNGGLQPTGAGNGGMPPGSIVLPGGGINGGGQPGYAKPQAHTLSIEVPCEPEMAAYVYQPPQEVVYAPTGNCFPQVPSVIQVPNAPAAVPAGTAPAQVLNIQTGHHGLHGLHGLHGHQGLHGLHTLHGGHGLHHTVKPLHHQIVQPTIVQPAAQTTIVQPAMVQPAAHAQHVHSGVQCTCQSTGPDSLAKSADANEALAMKFLQDFSRNAGASGQPMMMAMASNPGMRSNAGQMMPMNPNMPTIQ